MASDIHAETLAVGHITLNMRRIFVGSHAEIKFFLVEP